MPEAELTWGNVSTRRDVKNDHPPTHSHESEAIFFIYKKIDWPSLYLLAYPKQIKTVGLINQGQGYAECMNF